MEVVTRHRWRTGSPLIIINFKLYTNFKLLMFFFFFIVKMNKFIIPTGLRRYNVIFVGYLIFFFFYSQTMCTIYTVRWNEYDWRHLYMFCKYCDTQKKPSGITPRKRQLLFYIYSSALRGFCNWFIRSRHWHWRMRRRICLSGISLDERSDTSGWLWWMSYVWYFSSAVLTDSTFF